MATEVKDIALDDDFDLLFENGDLKISESDQQSIILILNTSVGAWKEFPTCGVGTRQYLASSGQALKLKREIEVQLQADGFQVNGINVKPNNEDKFDCYLDVIRP